MTARHLMQIAALASALGLTGTAVAETTYGTTSSDVRFSYGVEAPSSGAIVTPEDKAAAMGRDDNDVRIQNGEANDDTSNDNASNDDEMYVNPEESNDEDSTVNPGTDEASPRYGPPTTLGSITDDDSASVPPRTGADVQPGDMGPGNVRGQ